MYKGTNDLGNHLDAKKTLANLIRMHKLVHQQSTIDVCIYKCVCSCRIFELLNSECFFFLLFFKICYILYVCICIKTMFFFTIFKICYILYVCMYVCTVCMHQDNVCMFVCLYAMDENMRMTSRMCM